MFMLFLSQSQIIILRYFASVAKLVDALDLGSSGNPVGVRVSPLAPFFSVIRSDTAFFSKANSRWAIPDSKFFILF